MREQIGDESVFLRIEEFKKGLIQFTDSTNTMYRVKEHGRDIRRLRKINISCYHCCPV